MAPKRKLIEVALPLEAINRESAREKSIRHGHPSTLHLWWSRKPLAAARAVVFAQLVDDPSSNPGLSQDEVRVERERLHGIIERLVAGENVGDEKLYEEARQAVLESTDGHPPPILDPFSGGGTIPLEAQRLGLEVHASDLNPVAVLINKALIELPPKFRDRPPVFPGIADSRLGSWHGAEGLAADVRAYGGWMRDEAERRIGHLYPKAKLPDGSEATVIAWIWARAVTCPNPACGIEMPLVRSWWLGKKKGKEAYIVPTVVPEPSHPSGYKVLYQIGHDVASAPTKDSDGTVGRSGARCLACEAAVDLKYIRAEGREGRLGHRLMAVVAAGNRRRIYLPGLPSHEAAAAVTAPQDISDAAIPPKALSFRVQAYGMTKWTHLFTNRQLVALTTFSDLVAEARERVIADGGSAAYADAVATYLGLTVDRQADLGNALCRWEPNAECPRQLFAQQSIPMVWGFAEGNVLGSASGSWKVLVDGAYRAFMSAAFNTGATHPGEVSQSSASERPLDEMVISTDPPYYDNIGYSDLSDFFYVWLRRSLRGIYPRLLSTVLVPKADELVANPYRHGGRSGAEEFFESGFRDVFAAARRSVVTQFPITVYYAFKQSERNDEDGAASTGWETLLEGMIRSGWRITSTWPLRTETSSRMTAQNTNALASSIVLSLRHRAADAPTTDRRGFIDSLQTELPGSSDRSGDRG